MIKFYEGMFLMNFTRDELFEISQSVMNELIEMEKDDIATADNGIIVISDRERESRITLIAICNKIDKFLNPGCYVELKPWW